MTNFEKWKEGLTTHDVLNLFFNGDLNIDECFKLPTRASSEDMAADFDEWADSPAEDAPLTSTVVWHKYPDEKPPRTDNYLTCNNYGDVHEDCWIDDEIEFVHEYDIVTHWAELPEPTKK